MRKKQKLKLTPWNIAGIATLAGFFLVVILFLEPPTPTEVCKVWLSEYEIPIAEYDMVFNDCVEKGQKHTERLLMENRYELKQMKLPWD